MKLTLDAGDTMHVELIGSNVGTVGMRRRLFDRCSSLGINLDELGASTGDVDLRIVGVGPDGVDTEVLAQLQRRPKPTVVVAENEWHRQSTDYGIPGVFAIIGKSVEPARLVADVADAIILYRSKERLGVERFLREPNDRFHRHDVDDDNAVDIVGWLRSLPLGRRLGEAAVHVVGELISNAVIHSVGDGLHGVAEVALAYDGKYVAIAVRDEGGRLGRETVLRYLGKCATSGSVELDAKPSGAGLGLMQVFETSSKLVINIEPDVATEIVSVIDVSGGYRHLASRPKTLMVIEGAAPDAR